MPIKFPLRPKPAKPCGCKDVRAIAEASAEIHVSDVSAGELMQRIYDGTYTPKSA